MKSIKIDKAEIRAAIERGDNCDGSPVLVMSDSGEYRVGWRRNQGEDHFHPSDLILPIPALWPDGSGNEGIEAQECIERNLANLEFESLEAVEAYCEEQDISAVEFCEKFIKDDWEAQIENNLDFLLDNWLAALNEEPNDIYPNEDLYASGFDDYGLPLHRKRRFQFQWKVGAPKKNQNARKEEGRKEYIKIFAQRWDVPTGKAILKYLEEEGLSKKEWLDKYLLTRVFEKYPELRP